MPYSHLPLMSRERLDSSAQLKMSNCLDDLASVPDNDLVELVWENGQILMQGQSNKTRKSSPKNDFQSYVYKSEERDEGDAVITKLERTGNGGSVLNDFSSSGPMGMGQDDELFRWLNYPLDDYSEFFSELSGVNQNALSAQHNALPQCGRSSNYESRRGCTFTYGGVNSEQGNASKVVEQSPDLTRARGRSRVSDFSGPSAQQAHCGDSTDGNPNTKIHNKQGNKPTKPPQHPSNDTGFINFSHFLRPATLAKRNQQSPDLPSMDRIPSNSKVSVASNTNSIESTVVESNSVSVSIAGCQSQLNSLPGKMDVKSSMHKPTKDSVFSDQSQTICRQDTLWKSRSSDQTLAQSSAFTASTPTATSHMGIEPVVASSSVCSGNSTGDASNDPKRVLKRKSRETAESDYPNEDVEEESVGATKPTSARRGTGSKKSRAAEVHNLSERRRRDRINEKMRALQELIPNCNKVDKASMLDEAIEYLKTLQLQIQIMSMGIGLYMPPMMLPTGMQHMHAPNMASFSPMSVGMGMGMRMGMGFGMGMLNVSGSPSGCPLIQMPPMHGTHFSCPPHAGSSSMPKMTGPNHPMFGLPGQGQPMSMPPTPYLPISGGSSANQVLLPVSNVATSTECPNSIAPSHLKDPTGNMKTEMLKPDAECSQNQISMQDQAAEALDQSAPLQRNDRPQHASGVNDSTL